ncbi:hypothetical protein ABPG75_011162 [Micractinium tetrahymenae]
MRGLGLLRAARQAVLAAEPLGCGLAGEACGGSSSSAAATPLRQLPSLLGLAAPPQAPPHQRQQRAGLAARRRGDDDEDELPEGPRHVSKMSHAERKQLAERRLWQQKEEEQQLEEELAEGMGAAEERKQVIQGLLRGMAGQDAASKFVSSFFDDRQQSGAAVAAALRYRGEGGRYAAGAAAAAGGNEEGLSEGEEEDLEEELEEEEEEGGDAMEVSLPERLDAEEEFDLMSKLQGLRQGSRRIVLDKLLRGGIMRADPSAMREWQEIQGQFQPPDDFRMKVVDVNRTSKGTRTGGLYRYGCMVVVGNGNGVLGWGQGKAAEVNDAVQKAYQRACRNLYPVPRYNGHTIPEPIHSKYGQVKLTLYPKASGRGITANTLMREICKMAGIHDIGVKVHGSRNVRNAVKCLFQALDKMQTEEQITEDAAAKGTMVVTMPPGRYRHLKL